MRKLSSLLILIGATFIPFSSPAQSKTEPLPTLMHSFYSTLFELKPYITSKEKFENPKNKISKLIKKLEDTASSTSTPEISQSVGFNFTYNLLAQHIRDTRYLYEKEIYSIAYNHLKSTMGFCISCHDRLPKLMQYKSAVLKKAIMLIYSKEHWSINSHFTPVLPANLKRRLKVSTKISKMILCRKTSRMY